MRYREFQPCAALTPFVECFWVLQGTAPSQPGHSEPILPDGCTELILNFSRPFRRHHENGRVETQPRRFYVGQMERAVVVEPVGHADMLGVRFRPHGAYPFFVAPSEELAGKMLPLDSLANDLDRSISRRLDPEAPARNKIAILERMLLAHLQRPELNDPAVELAVGEIERTHGLACLDRLAQLAGISVRQLERMFLRWVGVGPKRLSRILRFQRVFRAVECNDAHWAIVAAECGYTDQAHLIRDFREFAGQTPSRLLSELAFLTETFARKGRVSHSYNTPA